MPMMWDGQVLRTEELLDEGLDIERVAPDDQRLQATQRLLRALGSIDIGGLAEAGEALVSAHLHDGPVAAHPVHRDVGDVDSGYLHGLHSSWLYGSGDAVTDVSVWGTRGPLGITLRGSRAHTTARSTDAHVPRRPCQAQVSRNSRTQLPYMILATSSSA